MPSCRSDAAGLALALGLGGNLLNMHPKGLNQETNSSEENGESQNELMPLWVFSPWGQPRRSDSPPPPRPTPRLPRLSAGHGAAVERGGFPRRVAVGLPAAAVPGRGRALPLAGPNSQLGPQVPVDRFF